MSFDKLIKIKTYYGYRILDYILKNKIIIDNIPNCVCKNINLFYQLQLVNDKYGDHKLYNKFINSCNLDKITKYNLDNLFNMYVITQKFNGFQKWGPGNNKNSRDNLLNHYHKHKNENWQINNFNLEIYEKFAIDKSKMMSNKIVHTNGKKVYLSGLYDKILIIGRLNDNKLGISSCYIIDDQNYLNKINIFNANMCWKL